MKGLKTIDEELEIEEFVDNFLKKDMPFKDKYLKRFLMDKIDPRYKCVIKVFDENNIVNEKKCNDINHGISQINGYCYKKIKLQIRLLDTTDIENLISFLVSIKPCLQDSTEEKRINQNRYEILDEILNGDDQFKTNVKINF